MGGRLSKRKFKKKSKKEEKKLNLAIREYMFPFKNLVIEGGGVKIIAAVGTVKILDEYNILKNITNFAGSSAGAMACALLAAGYSALELQEIMIQTDFNRFMDDSIGCVRDTYRFCTSYGICKGDYLHEWTNSLLYAKTNIQHITFQELHTLSGKNLFITALCVEDSEDVVFSNIKTPNMSVSLAVRMSMSIPFLYASVKHDDKHYIDGGLSNNYPINLFDKDKCEQNRETIGIKLMATNEKRDKKIIHDRLKTNSVLDFALSIMTHLMNQLERNQATKGYWERTISCPTGLVSTFDFKINKLAKFKLINHAYDSAFKQLMFYINNNKFQIYHS
jgi:NTE family protein